MILVNCARTRFAITSGVVRQRNGRSAIQQHLQDLVIVLVGGQYQRRDVLGEHTMVVVNALPGL